MHEDPLPMVTVVVPVYNDLVRLRMCVAALAGQDYPADRFEVVVVDNASSDDVRAALPDDDRFRLLREPRRGSYAARNTGVAAANGDVLAFTDSDCVPHRNWLTAGVAALSATPTADALGGSIRLTFRSGAPRTGPELYEARHGFSQRKYIETFSFAATANLFVPTKVFVDVGAFNADLKSGGDLDWGTRLARSGRHLAYADTPVVDHPARSTWAETTRKAVRVAGGLADLATHESRGTLLRRAVREVRRGCAVWVTVWTFDEPARRRDKIRYATTFSYVSLVRAGVRMKRALVG